MTANQTLADSKQSFHKSFPNVIPALYRRLADELLVELHLLSHQKKFKPSGLFALGLQNVFETFTQGYKPKEHLPGLFDSLCQSTGFNPNDLRSAAKKLMSDTGSIDLEKINNPEKKEVLDIPESLGNDITKLKTNDNYYSRLTTIGALALLSKGKITESLQDKTTEEAVLKLTDYIGFSKIRVEKDLSLYKSNLNKLNQAIELLNESIAMEKKKRNLANEPETKGSKHSN